MKLLASSPALGYGYLAVWSCAVFPCGVTSFLPSVLNRAEQGSWAHSWVVCHRPTSVLDSQVWLGGHAVGNRPVMVLQRKLQEYNIDPCQVLALVLLVVLVVLHLLHDA
jgi:hypothetical protein